MMSTEPSVAASSSSSSFSVPIRPRRYKIFQQRPKEQLIEEQRLLLDSRESNKLEKEASLQRQHSQSSESKIQFVKIPRKDVLEKQFYAQEEEEEQVVLVQPNLQGYQTVDSLSFGVSQQFLSSKTQPSVFLRFNSVVINEESELYQSVKDLKSSFYNIGTETVELSASVAQINASLDSLIRDGQSSGGKLEQIELFLEQLQLQKQNYEKKIEELDQRIQNLQFRESVSIKNLDKSQQGHQLKAFIQQKGIRIEADFQKDQMVQSQILPGALIAEFMEQRRLKAQQSLKKSRSMQQVKQVQAFHPCLGITQNAYSTLKNFITEQLKGKRQLQISFQLVFKRSTVDLDEGFFGDKQNLQYKECLLFVLRNGAGKTFGGFISNYLIEQEIRQDPHAFLFSLTDGINKFKVKQECSDSAYQASKHYLVCFGSDLMISSECIEEESYCEWPNSYQGRQGDCSMNWFAGDFTFTIEHIEIYEVVIK